MEGIALASGRLRIAPGGELGGREDAAMAHVGIEGGEERGADRDESGAGVGATMDVAPVVFGALECALEVEVVDGKLGVIGRGEETAGEGGHDSAHVEPERVCVVSEAGCEDIEAGFSGLAVAGERVEAVPDALECLSVATDDREVDRNGGEAAIDAASQSLKIPVLDTLDVARSAALQRFLHLRERVGHSQSRRAQRAALVIGEDAAHGGAVLENDGAGR